MVEFRKKEREENLQKKQASSSWEVKHYGSTTYPDASKSSISVSIRIQGIEKEAVEIVSEVPNVYLYNGEEICTRYVYNVLSKPNIHSSIRNNIFRKQSEELVKFNFHENRGFVVKVEVEVAVKEVKLCDYDYEEGLDEDCIICGEALLLDRYLNLHTLMCSQKHTFHRNCIRQWLRPHNNSCPTCGEKLDKNLVFLPTKHKKIVGKW